MTSPTTSMIRLHGFPISNYYNRLKMALHLKGLAFEEVRASPSRTAEYLSINPLGAIPTLEIDGQSFAETQPTMEYLDDAFPETLPLLPKVPIDRHRVRQIVNYIDGHIDKPLRFLRDFHSQLNATENTPPHSLEALQTLVLKAVEQGVEALNRSVRFAPYIAGNEITAADCAAYCTLPWFALLCERHLGSNPLGRIAGFDEYKTFMDQNPDFAAIHTAAEKAQKLLQRAQRVGQQKR